VKTATEIKRSGIIWAALIAVAALALIAAFFLDQFVVTWVSAHVSRQCTRVMEIVTWVGDWPLHTIAGAIGLGVAFAAKNKVWMRIFLAMLVALALAGIASRVIKITAGRARPFVSTQKQWSGPRFSSKFNAFPSGHTASSTAFFVALLLRRKKIGVALLPIPILIALSRILVDAHYLSDVTFAAILGVLCAAVAVRWICPMRDPQFAAGD
jgi:membrane-associated phospholipid phosphatase